VGLLIVVNQLGIDWSKAQWLVAALSVGLGFGLQEIVANFVAGIIILFERPVRIGDTVTVGGVSGTVSRIRIRATTILDWDRKELIIPNKSFVTDPVVNWTLSDLTTRVVVPIGIAYGADPQQALTVMETTVRENPLILKDPRRRSCSSVLATVPLTSSCACSPRIWVIQWPCVISFIWPWNVPSEKPASRFPFRNATCTCARSPRKLPSGCVHCRRTRLRIVTKPLSSRYRTVTESLHTSPQTPAADAFV